MSTTATTSSDEESDQFDVQQITRASLSNKTALRRRTLNKSEEDEEEQVVTQAAPQRRTSRRLTIQVNSNPALEMPTTGTLSQMKGRRPPTAPALDSDDDVAGPSLPAPTRRRSSVMMRRGSASIHVLQNEPGPPANDILAQIETRGQQQQQQQQQQQTRRQTRCSILHGLPGLQERRASRRTSTIQGPGSSNRVFYILLVLLKMTTFESFAMTTYKCVYLRTIQR